MATALATGTGIVAVGLAALLYAAGGAAATATGAGEATGGSTSAPSCLGLSASWRYTQVTNGCGAAHTVTVEYRSGWSVPCRTVAPDATVTFPGYGTQGDEVTGIRLCTAAS
ncbi:alpha-amylase [Streptomyces sp. NPDC046887]|uniref:alpha-amylase n=1 Tax=Streptomyces sp. NPDC046887 TaxID=3155472 RepID=UPI0033C9332F